MTGDTKGKGEPKGTRRQRKTTMKRWKTGGTRQGARRRRKGSVTSRGQTTTPRQRNNIVVAREHAQQDRHGRIQDQTRRTTEPATVDSAQTTVPPTHTRESDGKISSPNRTVETSHAMATRHTTRCGSHNQSANGPHPPPLRSPRRSGGKQLQSPPGLPDLRRQGRRAARSQQLQALPHLRHTMSAAPFQHRDTNDQSETHATTTEKGGGFEDLTRINRLQRRGNYNATAEHPPPNKWTETIDALSEHRAESVSHHLSHWGRPQRRDLCTPKWT